MAPIASTISPLRGVEPSRVEMWTLGISVPFAFSSSMMAFAPTGS